MLPELTKGALNKIISGEEVKEPILQLWGRRTIVDPVSGIERYYRLLMYDGVKTWSMIMLVPRFNELITNGMLSQDSIVQIKHYAIHVVKDGDIERKIMVILDIDILVPGHEVEKFLGSTHLGNTVTEEALVQFFNQTLHLHPN